MVLTSDARLPTRATRGRSLGATTVLALVVAAAAVGATLLYVAASSDDVAAEAIRNAHALQRVERALALDHVDEPLRRALGAGAPGAVVAWFYAFAYWPFVGAAIAATAWRGRVAFWRLLAAGASSGLVGVVVMVAFPTAPPRLVGHTDVVQQSPWRSVAHPESVTNPFAAMPSFHVAWSLLAAAALLTIIRARWARALVVLQPLVMTVTVIATSNHWILDAVAGALLAASAWVWLAPALVRLVGDARARDAERRAPSPATTGRCT